MMGLFRKIMALASLIPGPQQPFVIGGNMALGVGEHAYKRANDPDYANRSKAFGPGMVTQALGAIPGPQQPFVQAAAAVEPVGEQAYRHLRDPNGVPGASPSGVIGAAASSYGPLWDLLRRLQPKDQTGASDLMRYLA